MEKVHANDIWNSLELIFNKVSSFIKKYFKILWILTYILINIPVYQHMNYYSDSISWPLYIVVFVISGILSFLVIRLLTPLLTEDNMSLLLFICGIGLMLAATENYTWGHFIACVIIPLMFYIMLKYPKFCWTIPLICLAMDFIFTNFITTFILFFIVLIIYKYGRDNLFGSKINIIYVAMSAVVYILGFIRNYANSDFYIARLMDFQFYNDYFHFGFCTRGLMATIIYIIFGDNRLWSNIEIFLMIFHIICSFGIIGMSYLIYRESYKNIKDDYLFLFLAILVSGEIRFISIKYCMMYMDYTFILLALICIYLSFKSRFEFLIPILCAVAMCFHHIYGILCFPFLFVCMCYKCICKKNKKDIFLLVITTIVVVGLFAYFQFFAYRFLKMDLDEGFEYLRTAMGDEFDPAVRNMISYVVFNGKVADYGINFVKYQFEDYYMLSSSIFFNVLLLWPEVKVIKLFFKSSSKKIFGILALAQFIPLAAYMEIDYFRWDIAIAMFIPIILMVVLTYNEKYNKISLFYDEKRKDVFLKYVFIAIIMIVANA